MTFGGFGEYEDCGVCQAPAEAFADGQWLCSSCLVFELEHAPAVLEARARTIDEENTEGCPLLAGDAAALRMSAGWLRCHHGDPVRRELPGRP